MKTTKNKIIAAAAALAVIIAISAITAVAISGLRSSKGEYFRDVVDRVSFRLEPTEFELQKNDGGAYEIEFTFSAKKTEADFYAVINGIDAEGISYDSLVFENTSNASSYSPENLVLPAENGEAKEITWKIRMTVSDIPDEGADFSLKVAYTSGMTPDSADEHTLKVPMKIELS